VKLKYILAGVLLLIITGFFSACGGSVVGSAQDYKENQAPTIESFTCDISSSDISSIIPKTTTTLTVTTTDPENEELKYEFDSDDGSFSSQTATDNGATVKFTVGNYIVSSQSITATVKVTDGHKNSVSKTLVIGKANDAASVTITSTVPEYLKSTDQISFTFTATETGLYQVQVLDSGDYISFNSSLGQRVYYIGDEITVTVDGNNVSSSTADSKMDASTNVIAVVFQDATGDESYSSFTLETDDTGPVCTFDTATTQYSSNESFTIGFSADDGTGCGVSKISYTTDGTTPNFSGNGTVLSSNSGSISTTNGAIKSYELKVIAMDKVGNKGDVETFAYTIVPETVPPGEAAVSVTSYTDHEINLSWIEPEPEQNDYDHIILTWTVNGSTGEGSGVELQKGTTSYTINSGLDDEDEVIITATTYDVHGNSSVSTKTVTMDKLPPNEVSNLSITSFDEGTSMVTISWTVPDDEDYSYCHFTLDDGSIDNENNNTSTNLIILAGTEYTFTVKTSDAHGNESVGKSITFNIPDPASATIHLIKDKEDLLSIDTTEYGDYFLVIADITLAENEEWSPIGSSSNPFTGTFNGGGHLISDMTAKNGSAYCAFIGYLGSAGTICNVKINGCDINSNEDYTGGIAGYAAGTIENCSVSGSVKGGGYYTGGITGYTASGTVTGSSFSGTVTGSSYTGGISGYAEGISSINGCTITGSVTGTGNTGGIAGFLYASTITKCSVHDGTISGSGGTGGIAGQVMGIVASPTANITYSWISLSSSVTGSGSSIGGICGSSYFGCRINSCYNRATVQGGSQVGGILGYGSSDGGGVTDLGYTQISNCYSASSISGSTRASIVAACGTYDYLMATYSYVTGSNIYYDSTVFSIQGVIAATGLSSTIMASDEFFNETGWSTSIWGRSDDLNGGYPYLKSNPPSE